MKKLESTICPEPTLEVEQAFGRRSKMRVVWEALKEEQTKTEADLGEEPDLSQDEAIDDLDGIVNYYTQEGYAKGLRFALDLLTKLDQEEVK